MKNLACVLPYMCIASIFDSLHPLLMYYSYCIASCLASFSAVVISGMPSSLRVCFCLEDFMPYLMHYLSVTSSLTVIENKGNNGYLSGFWLALHSFFSCIFFIAFYIYPISGFKFFYHQTISLYFHFGIYFTDRSLITLMVFIWKETA